MKKWFIFMSMFLSIPWLIGHRSSNQPVLKTVGVSQAPPIPFNNLPIVNKEQLTDFKFDMSTSTTTTLPPPPPRVFHKEPSRSAPIRSITPTTLAQVAHIATPTNGCVGHKMSWDQAHACWDGLIDQYPWDHAKAFEIMYCESTGNSSAINSSDHVGLFQETGGSTDPATNVSTAYNDYYVPRHWSPWVCQ